MGCCCLFSGACLKVVCPWQIHCQPNKAHPTAPWRARCRSLENERASGWSMPLMHSINCTHESVKCMDWGQWLLRLLRPTAASIEEPALLQGPALEHGAGGVRLPHQGAVLLHMSPVPAHGYCPTLPQPTAPALQKLSMKGVSPEDVRCWV